MLSGMGGCRLPKDIQKARNDFSLLMDQLNEPSSILDTFRPGRSGSPNSGGKTQANAHKTNGAAPQDQNRTPNIPSSSYSIEEDCITTEQRHRYRWPPKDHFEGWNQRPQMAQNNVVKNTKGIRRKLEKLRKARDSFERKGLTPRRQRSMNNLQTLCTISNENLGARMDVPSHSRLHRPRDNTNRYSLTSSLEPPFSGQQHQNTRARKRQQPMRRKSWSASQFRSSITNEHLGGRLKDGPNVNFQGNKEEPLAAGANHTALSEYQTRYQWPDQMSEESVFQDRRSFPLEAWENQQSGTGNTFEEDSLQSWQLQDTRKAEPPLSIRSLSEGDQSRFEVESQQHANGLMKNQKSVGFEKPLASLEIDSFQENDGQPPQLDSGKAIYEGFESSSDDLADGGEASPFHATRESTPENSEASPDDLVSEQGYCRLAVERQRFGESDSTLVLVDGVPSKEAAAKRYNYGTSAEDLESLRNEHGRNRSGRCMACYKPLNRPPVVASSGIWERLYRNESRRGGKQHPASHRLKCNACQKGSLQWVDSDIDSHQSQDRFSSSGTRIFPKKGSYSVRLPLYGDSFCVDPKVSQVFMHPRLPLQSTLNDRRRSEYTKSYGWPEK